MALGMKLGFAALALCALPNLLYATSCTTEGALTPAEHTAISSTATDMLGKIAAKSYDALKPQLLPNVAGDWDEMRGVAESGAPLLAGGTIKTRNIYVLDATDQKTATDVESYCTTQDGALTVTVALHALPPGRFAIVLADAEGSASAGQAGLILGLDNGAWRLGGLFLRPGKLDNHDGVWYWSLARTLEKQGQHLSAWYAYEAARDLLIPVNFIASPNLDKLNEEQAHTLAEDPSDRPVAVTLGTKTVGLTNLHVDLGLNQLDLGFTYPATASTDPAAQRSEAISYMTALLAAHPDLKTNFHGLWAYGELDGKRTFAIELPMKDVP